MEKRVEKNAEVYETPKLEVLGNIADLTGALTSGPADGGIGGTKGS